MLLTLQALGVLQATSLAAAVAGGPATHPTLLGRYYSADAVLSPYIYVFYAAFLVAFVFTPVMRRVATYYNIVDQPDGVRKIHKLPVAYLGGVAVFLGWMAGLAISQYLNFHASEPTQYQHVLINFYVVLGACVIIVLGLWDDVRGLRPWVKIGGQMLAATCLLLSSDVGTRCAGVLIEPLNARLALHFHCHIPALVTHAVGAAMVYAVVVGCCNATNLMDGLDGLCGGVTAVIAGGFLFVAVQIACTGGGFYPNLDAVRVVLALALMGAVLGFVPYNFNPASIFMGDTGSMFLGYACATMILLCAERTESKWMLAAMIVFALPVLDTALAMARRWANRRPLFSADKYHFHHQLVARGFSVKQTVLISYALALFFALCGGSIAYVRTRYAVAFYLVIFGSVVVAAYKMGMVHEQIRGGPVAASGGADDAGVDGTGGNGCGAGNRAADEQAPAIAGTSPTSPGA